ncbi:bifunctional (p)ppGpp synthetase/guanosine-3',5'-bis(diphosphate) 3'-pyrophosphohydrolase [Pandoraea apista]|nr:bifunctional (p)ppGpp synthetase/guanosine-3',5'-bis(diphosphate) 3'-pyrophosphohydrolase [Pandoraea apista]RRX00098.1 bifunctional (p)ppGpp synthetase/guanosine-3',5'-bis(diphosphate) 3'-pyrophosphohydrolase [Pandoraea apista]
MSSPADLLSAIQFAAERHRNQRRKDVESSPYINHPIAVANLLATTGEVRDVAVLQAAVLHDTIEDTHTTVDELRLLFGQEVAQIVVEVTDDKSLPKQRRKDPQVQLAPAKSDKAALIKIADFTCNLRDLVSAPLTCPLQTGPAGV